MGAFTATVTEVYGSDVLTRPILRFSGRLKKVLTWSGPAPYLSAAVHFRGEPHSRSFGWYVPEFEIRNSENAMLRFLPEWWHHFMLWLDAAIIPIWLVAAVYVAVILRLIVIAWRDLDAALRDPPLDR
jgi:hypothetical protein